MKTFPSHAPRSNTRAVALIELIVAIGIATVTLIPLGMTFSYEQKLCRAEYYRAIALEIVDGGMETLVAGDWHNYKEGTQPYPVTAESAKNLPAGRFVLTLHGKQARLEWLPGKHAQGGTVVREATLR